jgi:hypothetical protein
MTLPTGTITMAQVNVELSNPSSTTISLNQTAVRALASIPSGTISMDDLRGTSAAMSASGGTEYTGPNYKLHAFTSPGTFAVSSAGPGTIEYVVIGGGGGGGGQADFCYPPFTSCTDTAAARQGAGGAGGYRTGTQTLTAAQYPITVGGKGGVQQAGGTSTFNQISATGGGRGGRVRGTQDCSESQNNGGPGGSGGGGHCSGGTGAVPPACHPICPSLAPSNPMWNIFNCSACGPIGPNPGVSGSPGGTGNAGQYSPVEGYDGGDSPSTSTPQYFGGMTAPTLGGGAGGGGAGGVGSSNGEGGDGVVVPTRFSDQLPTDSSNYVAGGGSSQLPYPNSRPQTIKAAGSYSYGGGRWCHPMGSSSTPSNEAGHDGIVVVSYPT